MRSIKVFGSMTRDDADASSDVDPGPDTSGFTLGALLMDAQDLLGRQGDVVTESALHPAMCARVLREARAL